MNVTVTNESPARAADQMYCHSCGYVLHKSAISCPQCGAQQASTAVGLIDRNRGPQAPMQPAGVLPSNHVYCRGCGQSIHETAQACPHCGAPQRAAEQAGGGSKNRVTAAVLAFVGGGIGLHKFYLGSIFLGIVYLVFAFTFIPAFVALIEGIFYLSMSDAEFSRRY